MDPGQSERKPDAKKVLGSGKDWLRLTYKLLLDILILIRDWLKRTSKLLLASLVFLIVGFLGILIARNGFFWFLFLLAVGIILLLIWFFRRFGLRIIGKEDVVDQWGILIGGGQGRAESIFDDTQNLITATKA
ncbi:unnamed protein product, partial [marine sediment metagenome]